MKEKLHAENAEVRRTRRLRRGTDAYEVFLLRALRGSA